MSEYTVPVVCETRMSLKSLLQGVDIGNLVLLDRSETSIAVKLKGYRENPGSRYSGLVSYHSPRIIVYVIEDGWAYPVSAWSTGRKR